MRGRLTEWKSKAEVIRCLKRYVAREIYAVPRPAETILGIYRDDPLDGA